MNQWIYALTVEEEAMSARIGYLRQEPYLGKPERNRNFSEGDVKEAWQHMVTVGSEIAAARMLGLWDFVPHVNVYKSRQDIPGYEVRYSFSKERGHSLRFNSSVDALEEIYILTAHGLETTTRRSADTGWKGTPYSALGWAYGYEIEQPKFLYEGSNYYVHWRELNPMESLPPSPRP
jgi:hypothetical protein